MDLAWIQLWAGLFYLLNKVFFWRAERARGLAVKRVWRIRSWAVYLAGLPAWVWVFAAEHDWIAAAVEAGGAPAMVAGLVMACRGQGRAPAWLDTLARLAVVAGLLVSLVEFGGLTRLSQFLELGISAGFLLGTYLMAQNRIGGYGWLMWGNVNCALLMAHQGFFVLMGQQLLSPVFVCAAWRVKSKHARLQVPRGRLPNMPPSHESRPRSA